jgi:predicted CoA-binding protein
MRYDGAAIDHFLKLKRIALVGVSRDEKDFSRAIWKEFREQGYEMVAVNPNAGTIDGLPAVASLSAINPPPEGVVIMRPASESLAAAREAVQCGIKALWFTNMTVSEEGVRLARAAGCRVVAGECPFMFLKPKVFPHSWHRGFKSLFGTLPQ